MLRNSRVNPETQARSSARSFAQSLDNFYGSSRDRRGERAIQSGFNDLGAVLATEQRQQKAEEREDLYNQGVADAIREEAGDELKGVKTGNIFRQHSKYYTKGLNEQRGKAAALRFKTDMMAEYAEWDGKNSDNPNDFRDWMAAKSGAFLEQYADNPDMLNAMLPVIAEVSNNTAVQHTSYTNDRLQKEQFDAFGEVIGAHLTAFGEGVHSEEELWALIKDETDELYDLEGGVANDALVDYVIKWSDANDSMDGVIALAKMHTSGTFKLSVSQQQQLENAADALEAEISRKASSRSKADKEARTAYLAEQENAYLAALEGDTALDPRTWMRDNGIGADAELFRKLVTNQKTWNDAGSAAAGTSGEVQFRFQAELLAAESADEKDAVLAKYSRFLSADQVRTQMKMNRSIADGTGILGNQIYKTRKDNYLSSMNIIEQGSGFDIAKQGRIKQRAEVLYDELSFRLGQGVDPENVQELSKLHLDVVEVVNQQLLNEFGVDLAEKASQEPSASASTGIGAEIDRQNEERRAAFEEDALNAGIANEAIQALDATSPQQVNPEVEKGDRNRRQIREATPEPQEPVEPVSYGDSRRAGSSRVKPAVEINAQETPFEDPESTEEYDEVREGFYGEIIKAFTDGVDNRPTIRDANAVFEEDPEFADEVKRLASKYEVDPMTLVAVMKFESGLSPSIRNKAGSGATGLIQFMPKTAAALGTTTDALAQMSRKDQMKYVEKYFDQFGSKVKGADVDDFYMAVLWPKAMGKPDGYPLFTSPSKAYEQNRGLDSNGDGRVTKFEAAAKVRKHFYS